MKKLLFAVLAVFVTASFTIAADKETPESIYAKIIEKSYAGKYKTIIIDKELTSSQLPNGMTIMSKTYFADDKFREETKTKDADGQIMNIVTIFTSEDTFISYDSGENFFSIGVLLMDEISLNIKNIDPFTPMAILNEELESINGTKCYVIEDIGNGLNRKFYIEKKTYNLIKTIFTSDEIIIVTDMSNYRKVNKFTAPFTMKLMIEQKTGEKLVIESEIKILSIQFNPLIDNNMFAPKNVLPLPDIPGMGDIKDMIQSMF